MNMPICAESSEEQSLQASFRQVVIVEFGLSVREAMLGRIVAFGGDPIFEGLAHDCARLLEIPVTQASGYLWPVTRNVYQAACSVNAMEGVVHLGNQ